MGQLNGKVAWVTGAGSGIGEAAALALAAEGALVVLTGRGAEPLESVARRISASGGRAEVQTGDMMDSARVYAIAAHIERAHGRIDILINNAALTVKGGGAHARDYFAAFEDYPLDLWERALQVNLTGTFLCCQAVGRQMVKQQRGVILNIASDVGTISPDHRIYHGVTSPHTGEPFNTPAAYATTKAGVINLTRYLATYWAHAGIRVNALSPGGVFADHDPIFVRNLTERIPLGRMAAADEYQGAVLFLVSDASSYMTGANLVVDGGRTAW